MVKDYLGNFCIILIIIPIILINCQKRESHLVNNSETDSTNINLIINGDFDEWNEQHLLSWWSSRLLLPAPKNDYRGDNRVSLHGSYIGKNFIYQKVTVRSGDYYIAKIKIINYEGRSSNAGIYILEEGETIGYHILPKRKYNKPQELSVKFRARSSLVEIRIGFAKIGNGSVVFDNSVLIKTDKIPITYNKNYATHLNRILKLELFDSSNFHSNILKISKYVNSILISPLRNYYLKDIEEQKSFLENERKKRLAISTILNELLPGSRFADYSKLDIKESANAYCVQASLSCDDLLDQFNIPVNQIHMWNNKGEAIHQFYQYWNPYLQKWVIVDPFYGINYVNEQLELIGYQELLELLKANDISTGNLKHVEVKKFYFNLEELRKGWNTQLKEGLFSDLRKTYPH